MTCADGLAGARKSSSLNAAGCFEDGCALLCHDKGDDNENPGHRSVAELGRLLLDFGYEVVTHSESDKALVAWSHGDCEAALLSVTRSETITSPRRSRSLNFGLV